MDKEKMLKKNLAKKKLLKFLVVGCVVLGITKFVLDTSVFSDIKIKNRVASNLPISVTMEDALFVKQYSIDRYLTYINNDEFKKAYSMFTDEYKDYKSYEDFLNDIDGIDFSTFKLQEVKELTEKTYVAPVEYMKNGELIEEEYLILVNKVNNKNMTISPNKFIYSFKKGQKFSKDGIDVVLKECLVNSDKITLKVEIKNDSLFKDITIKRVGIGYNAVEAKLDSVDNFVINSKESKTFEIEFTANYDMPKYLKIERDMEDTIRMYTFELEN